MAIEIRMPALSPTTESGTLAKWLVAVGDVVAPGDLLAEIETDKATMEFEAIDGGRISSLVVGAGAEDVAVGTVIALLTAADDAASGTGAVSDAERASEFPTPAPAPRAQAADPIARTEPHAGIPAVAKRRRSSPAYRVKVSPLAQRIASARNMDLSAISGSGPDGRIVRADLSPHHAAAPAAPAPAAAPAGHSAAPPPAGVPLTTEKLSTMRRTIARRLTEAKQTIPHFYLTTHCAIDDLLALRLDLNASLAERAVRLSVNDFLLKALALALEREPEANMQFAGDELHRFHRIDVSMAVAVEGGLVTPVIHDVARLSLSAIAEQSRGLAARARSGALQPQEYQGGTVSLSNLGMFGIDEMVPVINPPQAVIVGVGRARRVPWEVEGRLELATVVTATASFDHRAIDGATAARFLSAFREGLSAPLLLLS